MLNLFDVFDPLTKYLALNWFSCLIGMLLIPQIYWMKSSRLIMFMCMLLMVLWGEFKILMKNKFNMNNMLYFLGLFIYILVNNFMGLFPYIFTSSSHLVFSLIFSLSMWMGVMLFGWIKNIQFMFIHLVPNGTPFSLMFFMVFIETLSNIIRPITLSIRLTANMIAGHLLLILLSSHIPGVVTYLFILIIQLLLLMLEVFVSMIQAYVFTVLMLLYLKETN
uniref:ATP synthase subunit a n=1 Tax=Afrocampsis griseosetosus TaxID=1491719 RepID=A0A0U1WEI4_9HYME|nr:ATP synthase F0 subunit 6 [Afrocampsis griseosetosus]